MRGTVVGDGLEELSAQAKRSPIHRREKSGYLRRVCSAAAPIDRLVFEKSGRVAGRAALMP